MLKGSPDCQRRVSLEKWSFEETHAIFAAASEWYEWTERNGSELRASGLPRIQHHISLSLSLSPSLDLII